MLCQQRLLKLERIPQPFSRTFILFLRDLEILKVTQPYSSAIQKLCYFQILLNVETSGEQEKKKSLRMVGE